MSKKGKFFYKKTKKITLFYFVDFLYVACEFAIPL